MEEKRLCIVQYKFRFFKTESSVQIQLQSCTPWRGLVLYSNKKNSNRLYCISSKGKIGRI